MEHCKSEGSFIDRGRKSLTYAKICIASGKTNVHEPMLSIESYVEALRSEKDEWKEILIKKRIQCEDYEKQFTTESITITRTDVDDFLKEEDKYFLERKPNYLGMVELVKNYMDSTNYLNKYKLDLIDYYGKALNELEIRKKMLVDEMCAIDLCDICNIKNCGFPDHEFDQEFLKL